MMTQEADLGNLTEMAEGLKAFVQQAAEEGFAAHEVEMEIWQRVLAMGRQAMGRFFDTQGEGDVGDSIEMPDGQQWQRLDEPHRRLYQSIFGPFELERVVYGTREGQKIELVPLDEAERNTQLIGKRGGLMREYIGYIERLEDGHAGKLQGNEVETTAAIRRRLGSAAKYLGKELVVQRVGDQLYFWEEGSPGAPKRRRRRRKAKSS